MRLLLDTNILVPMVDGNGPSLPAPLASALTDQDAELWASVASIWEVAIKHRLGKIPLPCPLSDWPAALHSLNIVVLPVRTAHVITPADLPRALRDPFDRLLISICAAEHMRLLTLDRALADHPLAWKPGSA